MNCFHGDYDSLKWELSRSRNVHVSVTCYFSQRYLLEFVLMSTAGLSSAEQFLVEKSVLHPRPC